MKILVAHSRTVTPALAVLLSCLCFLVSRPARAADTRFTRSEAESATDATAAQLRYAMEERPWLRDYYAYLDASTRRGTSPADARREFLLYLRRERQNYIASPTGTTPPGAEDFVRHGLDFLGALKYSNAAWPVGIGVTKSLWDAGWDIYRSTPAGRIAGLRNAGVQGLAAEVYFNRLPQALASRPELRPYLRETLPQHGTARDILRALPEFPTTPGARELLAQVESGRGFNLTQTDAMAIFGELLNHIDGLSREAITANREAAERYSDLLQYLQNDAAQRAEREAQAQATALREAKLHAAGTGIQLLARIVEANNPELANQISVIGGSFIQVAQGLNAYQQGGALGATLLTGNALGAAINIVGLFSKRGPSPEQQMLKAIGQIKAMLNQIRMEMHERFDKVDRSLDLIYRTMVERLGEIERNISLIQGNIGEIQSALFDLMAQLNNLDQKFTAYLQEGFRRPLIQAADEALDYEEKYGVAMPWDEFLEFHKTLYAWPVHHAKDELSTGGTARGLAADRRYHELTSQPLCANINYVNSLLEQLGLTQISTQPVPRSDDLLLGANASLRLAQQNPQHAAKLSTQQYRDIADACRVILHTVTNVTIVSRDGRRVANSQTFAPLFSRLRSNAIVLTQELAAAESRFMADNAPDPARREAFGRIDLWGSPDQPVSWLPPLTTVSPAPDVVTHRSAAPLSLPHNWQAIVPNLSALADLLGVAPLTLCHRDYDMVNTAEVNVSRLEENWHRFLGLVTNGYRVTGSGGRITLSVSVHNGGERITTTKIVTGDWMRSHSWTFSDSFWVQRNGDDVSGWVLTNIWFVPQTPLAYWRAHWYHDDEGALVDSRDWYEDWWMRGANLWTWSEQLELLWNGGLSSRTTGGYPFLGVWIEAPVPLRGEFTQRATNSDCPIDVENRHRLTVRVSDRLKELQRARYSYLLTSLSQVGGLHDAAIEFAGTRELLASLVSLGFPESLMRDDYPRALLHGNERVPDPSNLEELCRLGIARSYGSTQAVRVDIGAVIFERIAALEWWVTNRLAEVERTGRAETLTTVEATANQLDLLIALHEKSKSGHETNLPVVTVASPTSGTRVANSQVSFTGTTGGRFPVSEVFYWTDFGSPMHAATGTASWSGLFEAVPGTNYVSFMCMDDRGNPSRVVTISFVYEVVTPIDLRVSGAGTVNPSWTGENLQIGRNYTITAIPRPGFIFMGWTGSGGITSSLPTLNFRMQSNFVLRAVFAPNPFPAVTGRYVGLLQSEPMSHEGSGLVDLTVTSQGNFTGFIRLGNKRIPINGRFDMQGRATVLIRRPGKASLTADLSLVMEGQKRLMGTVSGGGVASSLIALRTAKNGTGLGGNRYTLAFPGANEGSGTTVPALAGYAALGMDGAGRAAIFSGTLSDNSKVVQRGALTEDGQFPIHVTTERGRSAFFGWLTPSHTDVNGLVTWIKTADGTRRPYPEGFVLSPDAIISSRYFAPSVTNRVLNLTNGVLSLFGGNLADLANVPVRLSANSRFTSTGSNRFAMSVFSANGIFRGSHTSQGSRQSVLFSGVVLQDDATALGFHVGTNRVGTALLQAAPLPAAQANVQPTTNAVPPEHHVDLVETNIALNPARTGFPHALESDTGWGGGNSKSDLLDGVSQYSTWARGLAFTGGSAPYGGQPAGVRQVTIDFGAAKQFHRLVVWHHGLDQVPAAATVDYFDNTGWHPISFQRVFDRDFVHTMSGVSNPDTYSFATPVTGSKVRYSFDNSGLNILGTRNTHGWIYEIEVFGDVR